MRTKRFSECKNEPDCKPSVSLFNSALEGGVGGAALKTMSNIKKKQEDNDSDVVKDTQKIYILLFPTE